MSKVLVVDDSVADRNLVEVFLQAEPELHLLYASHGREALAAIERDRPDIVLTDMHMPVMDGLELVQEVRQKHSQIPIILMTAYGSEELAMRALKQGAASYVAKSHFQQHLLDTVLDVLAAATAAKDQQRVLGCVTQSELRFALDNDESLITPLYGFLEAELRRFGFCNSTELIRLAVVLREALVNAIQHGNLEVGSGLLVNDSEAYYQLLKQRRQEDPYQQRRVHVTAIISRKTATYSIRDEGPGFDPSCLPDSTDPANLEKPSGRGLLLIRTFMDEVFYNKSGNQITMVKKRLA